MINIDKQALTTESARESGNILLIVAARMARRELFTPLHYVSGLPQKVVGMRIFREALEQCEETLQREVCKIVDGHNRMAKKLKEAEAKLEAAERRIAELSKAASVNNHWKPDVCPITGRMFFMWIEHETLGYVPTYGGPFDSYTIPTRDSDGEFSCERYDHDFGGWREGECIGLYLTDDDEQCRVHELEQHIAELESKNGNLRTIAHEQNELAIRASLDSNNATVEMGRLHKRIAELEARKVNLPAACADDEYFIDGVFQALRYERDVERAILAAGIKVKGE